MKPSDRNKVTVYLMPIYDGDGFDTGSMSYMCRACRNKQPHSPLGTEKRNSFTCEECGRDIAPLTRRRLQDDPRLQADLYTGGRIDIIKYKKGKLS